VLVLGAGIYAVPLIKALRRLNRWVVASSYDANEPGFQFAHQKLLVSTTDVPQLKQLILSHEIEAIFTTASDWNTFSQAALNDHFSLNGVNSFQVKQVSEKTTFFDCLQKLNLPVPKTTLVALGPDTLPPKNFSNFILKPVQGSGSTDVFKNPNHIPESLFGKKYLLQEYIEGKEYGGQAFVENQKIQFLQLSEKYLVNEVVPFAHLLSRKGMEEATFQITNQLDLLVRQLEFESGTVNIDVRFDGQNYYLIDCSLRLSGNNLIDAMNMAFDFNFYDYHCCQILQQERALPQSFKKEYVAAIVLGTATAKEDLKAVQRKVHTTLNETNVAIIELQWDDIQQSKPFVAGKHRIGHVLVQAEDKLQIEILINQLKKDLEFR
jgi:predicted ATP-grasp superfamily ATP-dependent carboligase